MTGIYLITNNINNKRYVGLSNNIKRRFAEHRTPKNIINRTSNIAKAFRKYNVNNFSFEIIELVSDINDLASREVYWIQKLKPEYNMNEGGLGNKGHKLSDEFKKMLSTMGKLQWESKSEKEKEFFIKNNLKGVKKGHLVSEKTRNILREKNLGKKHSKETRDKISKSNKISCLGNKNGNKKVSAIKDGKVVKTYNSVIEAAYDVGIKPTYISAAIHGRQKTAAGYKWIIPSNNNN